jgi:hypothetical protein
MKGALRAPVLVRKAPYIDLSFPRALGCEAMGLISLPGNTVFKHAQGQPVTWVRSLNRMLVARARRRSTSALWWNTRPMPERAALRGLHGDEGRCNVMMRGDVVLKVNRWSARFRVLGEAPGKLSSTLNPDPPR